MIITDRKGRAASGLSFVEILIVVTLLALLAMLAISGFDRVSQRSADTSSGNNTRQISASLERA